MNTSLLLLTLCYSALAAITVLMLLYSRLPWALKLAITLLLPLLYLQSYHGWKAAQGWPAHTELPARFLLHAAVIEEPDDDSGSRGFIDLWATDLADDHPAPLPRAYHIDYRRDLHGSVEDALRKMRNGQLQLGIRTTRSANEKTPPKDFSRLGSQTMILEFMAIPDPALPEK